MELCREDDALAEVEIDRDEGLDVVRWGRRFRLCDASLTPTSCNEGAICPAKHVPDERRRPR